ncbi:Protein ssh4 [Thecaphora frezii]
MASTLWSWTVTEERMDEKQGHQQPLQLPTDPPSPPHRQEKQQQQQQSWQPQPPPGLDTTSHAASLSSASVDDPSSSPRFQWILSSDKLRSSSSSFPSSSSSSSDPQKSIYYSMLNDSRYRSSDVGVAVSSPSSTKDASQFRRPMRGPLAKNRQVLWGFQLEPDVRLAQSDPTPPLPGGGIDIGDPVYHRPSSSDDTLAILLPLLILLSTLLLLLLLFIVLVILIRRRARIALGDSDGPIDVGREEELEGHGGLEGVEQRWLETQDPAVRQGYARTKDWCLSYPPGSQSTDITLSQFLSIQEKGVSAWSFDPDYESNPSVFVESRTEITFLADGEGMAPSEGGGCCVQSNLPLPKINEVYYWEAKMFNKPDSTNVALGLTTKPYPGFRMPGYSKYSIGYFSSDGFKCHNYPFAAQSYGPAYGQGDVIGVGYRPRTGTVFFTRNGKRLEDAFIGLHRYNLFPTVGADAACEIHVNLGQAGFVFIEANVKKWGLAPMVGTLAPPPAYGQERGSILIETGQGTSGAAAAASGPGGRRMGNVTPPPPISPYDERAPSTSSGTAAARGHRPAAMINGTPMRTSSLHNGSPSSQASELSVGSPPNPPTPHRLDISLHSLNSSEGTIINHQQQTHGGAAGGSSTATNSSSSSSSYFPPVSATQVESLRAAVESGRRSPSPPPYSSVAASSSSVSASASASRSSSSSLSSSAVATDRSPTWLENGSLGGTASLGARRASGRTHAIANAVLGMLGDRGLLTPLSAQSPGWEGRDADLTTRNTRRNAENSSAEGWRTWLGFRT